MTRNDNAWLLNNSILKNEEYIESLLQDNKFKRYNITADGFGDYSLIISQGLEDYKVEIDKNAACFKIFMRNKALNKKGKEKYRLIKIFECKDFCEVIEYVKDKGLKKYNLAS